jgi:hypothetical protein
MKMKKRVRFKITKGREKRRYQKIAKVFNIHDGKSDFDKNFPLA